MTVTCTVLTCRVLGKTRLHPFPENKLQTAGQGEEAGLSQGQEEGLPCHRLPGALTQPPTQRPLTGQLHLIEGVHVNGGDDRSCEVESVGQSPPVRGSCLDELHCPATPALQPVQLSWGEEGRGGGKRRRTRKIRRNQEVRYE